MDSDQLGALGQGLSALARQARRGPGPGGGAQVPGGD